MPFFAVPFVYGWLDTENSDLNKILGARPDTKTISVDSSGRRFFYDRSMSSIIHKFIGFLVQHPFKVTNRRSGIKHGDMLCNADGYETAQFLRQLQPNEYKPII